MKKIRMIKENDLFDWKVGDVYREDGDYLVAISTVGRNIIEGYKPEELVSLGYAEWVEEEPGKIGKLELDTTPSALWGRKDFKAMVDTINELIEVVNKLREDVDKLNK